MSVETLSSVALREVVERLAAVPGREERLTHLEVLPARAAVEAEWPGWVPDDVRAAFEARGLLTPWRHQVEAAEAAHAGRHVVMATGTASGKSLGYQLPTLAAIRSTRGPRQQRGAATLYLSPTKALAQDQLAGLESLGLDVRFATHDGDSPREQREWTRDHAEYVLTNPDMLHRSLLPAHHRWAQLPGLAALRRGRRVPPLPRRLRRPRRAGAAPAAAGVRGVRRPPDVRARLGHRRRARGARPPADRPRRAAGRRRRVAARPGRHRALGAAVHVLLRRARRARAPRRLVRGRRPAGRPGRRGRAHPRLHPVAARGRAGRADRGRPARRRRPGAGRPGRGLPRRLPPRGTPRDRASAAHRASSPGWPPPTRSSWASTSAVSTPW